MTMPGHINAGVEMITVAELLDHPGPLCARQGPAWSRCMRQPHESPLCAALGTDAEGAPVVVSWYRPDAFPILPSARAELDAAAIADAYWHDGAHSEPGS